MKELGAAALKGLTLTPTADNTLLLYDNAELGLRFVYPRRWRVAGGVGRQVRLDGADGSGLQITLDPPAKVPAGEQFLAESRDYFAGQKAKVFAHARSRPASAAGRASWSTSRSTWR